MAFELPETAATGVNTTSPSQGLDNMGDPQAWLPAGASKVAETAPAAVPERSMIGKLGLVLEAFGSGYRGEEPLFLKLRRQQMLEEQQLKEQQMKLLQMKAAQTEQANTLFFKSVDMLKSNPKAMNQLIEQESQKGVPAAALFKRVGVTTKDVDLLTSPEFMGELATLAPEFHTTVVDALKSGDVSQVDPNRARYYADAIQTRKAEQVKVEAEANDFAALKVKSKAGALTPYEVKRFNKYMDEEAKQAESYAINRVKAAALTSSDKGTAESAAGMPTPDAIAAQTKARQEEMLKLQGGTEMQNGIALAMFDKSFAQLDPPQREKVLARQLEWDKQVAATKAAGGLEVPEEVGKRTNIISVKALRNDNVIVHPPAGITKAQMRKGEYVELSDKQMEGWNKLQTARGQANLAFDTIEPYIKAKTGAEALKQAGQLAYRGYVKGDLPDVRAYDSMKDALASIMARFVEVGVLTNTDVTRWSKTVPGLTETVGSFAAKKRIYKSLYGIASDAMKDSLLGDDPAKLTEKYQNKIGKLLSDAEKTATPEDLQDDLNTLLKRP